MERRSFAFEYKDFSEKSEGDSSFGVFKGYGAVFNNIDYADDVIAPGAFKSALVKQSEFPMFYQHHLKGMPIGKFTAVEDSKGLYIEAKLVLTTTLGKDAFELVKSGVVTGLSIGYDVTKSHKAGDKDARVIDQMELFEVSLTPFPCNDRARITSIKSFLDDEAKSLSDVEDMLRDREFSRSEAKALISKIKEFSRRDAEKEVEGTAYADLLKTINDAAQSLV